jgi:hypothetical protein
VTVATSVNETYARFDIGAVFKIGDQGAVRHAALAAVDAWIFATEDVDQVSKARKDARAAVRESLVEALHALVEPERMVNMVGSVELQSSAIEIQLCDRNGRASASVPPFADLFALCRCGHTTCPSCSGWQLTPRIAAVLWSISHVLADLAYGDVEIYGDDPVTENLGSVLHQYPRITWRQDAVWRRQAARAYDDLAGDIENGHWPMPRCVGEEMALRLILAEAAENEFDEHPSLERIVESLPAHPDDADWDLADDALLQDHDLANLFRPALDGIEDPDNEINKEMGIGDYRPAAWFRWFLSAEPRDGRRPFRR